MHKLFIVAGEPSGDMHASKLAEALRSQMPDIKLYGLGGPLMQESGVELLEDITKYAVTGFFEVITHLAKFHRIFNLTLKRIEELKPDAVVLVDYPGFNLRLAKKCKQKGIKVIYYISPQIWAWGKNRIKTIRSSVDKMLVLFKFEEELYKKEGADAVCVGHPLVDIVHQCTSAPVHQYATIALLPGSRYNEAKKHLPIMLKTAEIIRDKLPDAKFFLSKSPNIEFNNLSFTIPDFITVYEKDVYELLNNSTLAIVSSGTATLESAIFGVPMIIIYKTAFLSYLIGRCLLRIPDIGLVNIVAGKRIVPEFLQYQAKPESIARYAIELLQDEQRLLNIRKDLSFVRTLLGTSGASCRAAEEIIRLIVIA